MTRTLPAPAPVTALSLPVAALCALLLATAATPARAADDAPAASTSPTSGATPDSDAGGNAAPSSAPFDAPFSTPFGTAPATDTPFDPNFDAAMPTMDTPVATPADTPAYAAPDIDAYVDLSFTDSDIGTFGLGSTAGGYRFIAGFRLAKPLFANVSFAPEVGYLRIGKASDTTSKTTNNIPISQYENTRTETRQNDISTLQFGARFGVPVKGPVEAYARAGAHFYHLSHQEQVIYSYTPIPPNTTPRADDVQKTLSTTDVGVGPFGALGLSVSFGQVPSAFIEYGSYSMGGKNVATTAFGFLLNF